MEPDKFNLIGAGTKAPFGGYISAQDRTALSRRFMVLGSKNVYLKRSGTIATRPGLSRRGSADSTNAGVDSSYEWENSLGRVLPIRVSNSKLEVESDIVSSGTYVWYTLLDSLTTTRYNFAPWWDNTAKKDILIFCDGTDTLNAWSGGLGILNAATTTSTIIGLTATAASLGFRSGGGTVIINGTEYTYTGTSGSTLTGAQDATSEADGSVVIDKPASDADTPADGFLVDFIKVIGNQLYCGSDTSRLIYISKNDDYTDFTFASPRIPGDGEVLTLDEFPTGIGTRQGEARIGSKRAWYEVSFNQITVSTTLSEQTTVKRIPLSDRKGPLRHEFIDNIGNDLVYLSEDQQMHVYGTFTDITEPQFPSLSEDIRTELTNEDFTGGHLRAIGDFIYITAPNNGRVWLHETRTSVNQNGNIQKEKFWHPPFVWNLARIAVISGTEYGHSNSNPQIYQMWDTLQWHDDSPSDEPIPYDCVAAFAYFNSQRYDKITFDHVFYEGYMSPGSDVRGAVVFEYQGEASVQEYLINESGVEPEFFIGDVGISLGEASIGDSPLGDLTSDVERNQELIPKFKIMSGIDTVYTSEYQVRIYSTQTDSRWELLSMGTNEAVAEEEATEYKR